MGDIWDGVTWNENGELVLDVYTASPGAESETAAEETDEEFEGDVKHTYKEIDCGGECGGCVALVVDGAVVSGPPFHPNCTCSLSAEAIADAPEHESNLSNPVGPDRNSGPRDVKWLKKALIKLGYYEPDTRPAKRTNNY